MVIEVGFTQHGVAEVAGTGRDLILALCAHPHFVEIFRAIGSLPEVQSKTQTEPE